MKAHSLIDFVSVDCGNS